ELKPNYQNSKNNPGCSKMALIAQRELAEMLLQNCSEYLPPAELDGMKKTKDSLTSQINGMADCKNYNYGK
ncbi:MAG: hypothetical protein NTU43_04280, partial [Bacteroidetes bacterium]|nr:hypothetical protein [Bacteroidota bacterium]